MSKRIEELDKNFQAASHKTEEGFAWFTADKAPFVVNGLAWFKENGGEFYRLPKRAKGVVRDVLWELGTMPCSGRVRFKTDSPTLRVRLRHSRPEIAMPHMSAVGTSGVDLYEGSPKTTTYWASSKAIVANEPYIVQFFNDLPKKLREFTIYFPTYNDLVQFEIGIVAGSALSAPTAYRLKKPVVFYGTSITQGGCSSRAATGFVPVVGRKLTIDVINLGFSGNGRCDPELVPFFAEIDMACLVMDPVTNMGLARMKTDYVPFLNAIRARRPKLPLALMTGPNFAQDNFTDATARREASDIAVETYRQMRRSGDKNVHLIETRKFVAAGPDHPSVDGVHMTDLGFWQMANGVAPALKKILRLP